MLDDPTLYIFAFAGRMEHGKSTCARMLAEIIAGGSPDTAVRHAAFAATLKQELVVDCGFPRGFIDGKTVEARQLMQAYGQARRAVDPFYWVQQILNTCAYEQGQLASPLRTNRVLALDDLRFPNELVELSAFALRFSDVRLMPVKVTRLNDDGSLYISDQRTANDLSETAVTQDYFPHSVIAKSGELTKIYSILTQLVKDVGLSNGGV